MLRAAAAAVVAMAGAAALAPAAGAQAPGDFSCRGSAARAVDTAPLVDVTVEPAVANAANQPCQTDGVSIVGATAIGAAAANALEAATTRSATSAAASAGVTGATIVLPGLTIGVQGANASAAYACQGTTLVASSDSQVVGLTVNGAAVTVPAGPFTHDLGPLGSLALNQTVTAPDSVTRRAFFLDTPLVDVVLGEAIADISGTPCAGVAAGGGTGGGMGGGTGGATPPACADGLDNDGDGRIDGADGGCASATDDNEATGTTTPPGPVGPGTTVRPDCSDGFDNDGDGRMDSADRGCASTSDRSELPAGASVTVTTNPASVLRNGASRPAPDTFRATVTPRRGSTIRFVEFFLDGRRIRTDRRAPYTVRVNARRLRPGIHRLRIRTTLQTEQGTVVRNRVIRFRVGAGGRPRFTG